MTNAAAEAARKALFAKFAQDSEVNDNLLIR